MTTLLLAALLAAAPAPPPAWFEDPNASRYLLSLSALPMKPGQAYVSIKEGLALVGSAGVTPWLSVRAGTIPYWWFATPSGSSPINPNGLVSARASFELVPGAAWFAAGAGASISPRHCYCAGQEDGYRDLFGFATVTALIPGGLGHLTVSGALQTLGGPYLTVAANLRVDEHVALLSETWLFTSEALRVGAAPAQVTTSAAVRLFGRQLAVDVGVAAFPARGGYELAVLPWVDFTVNFGNRP